MRDLQEGLVRQGRLIVIDGIFGRNTQKALAEVFPRSHGRAGFPEAKELCVDFSDCSRILGLVSFFNDTTHDHIEGNHDGGGLTFGIMGLTALKGGSFITYLKRLRAITPDEVWESYNSAKRWSVIDRVLKMKKREAQNAIKRAVGKVDDWKIDPGSDWTDLARWLGSLPGAVELQKHAFTEQYYKPACADAERLGHTDLRFRTLLTVIRVAVGDLKLSAPELGKLRLLRDDNEVLELLCDKAAGRATAKTRQNLRDRLICVRFGEGKYNEADFSLKPFGLS